MPTLESKRAEMCCFEKKSSSLEKWRKKNMKQIWKFINDEDGMEIVEYAVIGAMIVVGTIVTILAVRGEVTRVFNEITNALKGSPGT